MKSPTDAEIANAKSVLRADYYQSIRSLAEGIKDEARDEKPENRDEWLHDRIHETADGSYWVIYTHANLQVMMASGNWLACEDEGIAPTTDQLSELLPIYAYSAVCADLQVELDGFGEDDE